MIVTYVCGERQLGKLPQVGLWRVSLSSTANTYQGPSMCQVRTGVISLYKSPRRIALATIPILLVIKQKLRGQHTHSSSSVSNQKVDYS